MMEEKFGNWFVTFDPATVVLTLRHPSGAELSGKLSVSGAGSPDWKVASSRDAVRNRLALLDAANELVQGYLTFAASGDRIEIRASHRSAQSFAGSVAFAGTAQLPGSFSCRIHAPDPVRVVQFGAGRAASRLNRALYDRENDRCLTLDGGSGFELGAAGSTGAAPVQFTLELHRPARAALTLELIPDFYRDRYAPYFKPIDRKRCPSPPTGWMSWNVYFDQAGAVENLAEARIGATELKPFGLEFWSIESWQADSDRLPVSSFDNLSLRSHVTQFPEGMKKLCAEIRELGFRPGIWAAPFGTGSREFYEQHPGWFLHDETGKPIPVWNGRYTLDPSVPEVQEYLRHIFDVMSHDWGYEFFKIDGMSGRQEGYGAHFFEQEATRRSFADPAHPAPFEACVKSFRDGIGEDRIFLACQGHFGGPEAGYADAARIGGDIVHPNTFSNWRNAMDQVRATLNQAFVNNIVFFTDPDTILVGNYRTLEEARVTTTVVSLPGQMMFAGDKLAELPPERMKLLQQTLPVCDVHPMDLYPIFDFAPIWDLKVERPFGNYDVVALFNYDDREAELGFDFAELGLDDAVSYAVYEFWTAANCGVHRTGYRHTVPAHAVRLFAVHACRATPQFLSSDRHVTQGAVDLEALEWNAAKRTLLGEVRLVPGFPTTLTFRSGDGFRFLRCAATGAESRGELGADDLVRVTLRSATGGVTPFALEFM